MWKRFVAMLAVTALLFGGIVLYYGTYGTEAEGVFYEATGVKGDAWVMKVNGEKVEAREYFYWLDSVTQYLLSYAGGQLDFNAPLTDTLTAGQYAKADAANTAITYAVVRQLAAAQGVALTAQQQDYLDAQRAQYIDYYGGEEMYALQLQALGVPEEMYRSIESVPYLYEGLYQAYTAKDGPLYPGDAALQSYAAEEGYVTAQLLYFPTAELDGAAAADMKAKAEEYAAQLQQADDKNGTYAQLAASLGLEVSDRGLTFQWDEGQDALHTAVSKLPVGQVSGVVEADSGFFVALRLETDCTALAEELFNIDLQNRQKSAKVEYNERIFQRIDAGSFCQNLYEERAQLLQR